MLAFKYRDLDPPLFIAPRIPTLMCCFNPLDEVEYCNYLIIIFSSSYCQAKNEAKENVTTVQKCLIVELSLNLRKTILQAFKLK